VLPYSQVISQKSLQELLAQTQPLHHCQGVNSVGQIDVLSSQIHKIVEPLHDIG
jgi:hypothetical protein